MANFNLTGDGEPERIRGTRTTASLFPTLGVAPLIGHTFTEAEQLDPERAAAVAVLSYSLWQRRFGADPGILHRKIRLNGRDTEVIGVMPPEFHYPSRDYELWEPLYYRPRIFALVRISATYPSPVSAQVSASRKRVRR